MATDPKGKSPAAKQAAGDASQPPPEPQARDARRDERIARLRDSLARARRVCVLTGAGVSAESGVPVYRGNEGLYQAFSAADMATPEGFARNPEKVWAWYIDRRRQLLEVKPNPGHAALARLEQLMAAQGRAFRLVTQNIDGLHQAAGSRDPVELHGNIWKTRCTECGTVSGQYGEIFEGLPRCARCKALCRPHIVWFGELLDPAVWQSAVRAACECDFLLSVGTSAAVQPAAGLIHMAAANGALVAEINLEETANTRWVDLSLLGKSGEILPRVVE